MLESKCPWTRRAAREDAESDQSENGTISISFVVSRWYSVIEMEHIPFYSILYSGCEPRRRRGAEGGRNDEFRIPNERIKVIRLTPDSTGTPLLFTRLLYHGFLGKFGLADFGYDLNRHRRTGHDMNGQNSWKIPLDDFWETEGQPLMDANRHEFCVWRASEAKIARMETVCRELEGTAWSRNPDRILGSAPCYLGG